MISIFEKFPWQEKLELMDKLNEDDIHFSPSLGFQDEEEKKGISITIVGDDEKGYVFYLFYEREKEVSKFFGLLKEKIKSVADLLDRSIDDCIDVMELFRNRNFSELEKYFKE